MGLGPAPLYQEAAVARKRPSGTRNPTSSSHGAGGHRSDVAWTSGWARSLVTVFPITPPGAAPRPSRYIDRMRSLHRRRIVVRSMAAGLGVLPLLLASGASADWLADLEAPFREALAGGDVALALGFVFLAGLATSLTPCVYPMIAITVSVFGARQSSSRAQAAMLSTVFVLGIASLFTPLGIVVALTGGVFGSALSSPVVLVGLALLFSALALGMFGAYEFALPPGLSNRLAQVGGSGYRGAFALGFVSGLVAAPCTGPVLAALLTWVGTTGDVAFGAAALFLYALGLGVLFWLVGTFAVSLPKSGPWLEGVKSFFGVVMLVMALYYLRDLLPFELPHVRSQGWLLGALMALGLGLLLGAVHLSFHDPSRARRLRKGLGVVLAVGGAFAAVGWAEALPPGSRIAWREDFEAARREALHRGRPMLVDFSASWCGACGELERETFSDPRVVSAARSFVTVKVDLSPGKDSPRKRALLSGYDQRGLPLVVVHDCEGKEVGRITTFVPPERVLPLLEQAGNC